MVQEVWEEDLESEKEESAMLEEKLEPTLDMETATPPCHLRTSSRSPSAPKQRGLISTKEEIWDEETNKAFEEAQETIASKVEDGV